MFDLKTQLLYEIIIECRAQHAGRPAGRDNTRGFEICV